MTQNPVSTWTTEGVPAVSGLLMRYNSERLKWALSHPKVTPNLRNLQAGRHVLRAITDLKGVRPPYLDLVSGIDELADACVAATDQLNCVEQSLHEQWLLIEREEKNLSLDSIAGLVQASVIKAVAETVMIVTSIAKCKKANVTHLRGDQHEHIQSRVNHPTVSDGNS